MSSHHPSPTPIESNIYENDYELHRMKSSSRSIGMDDNDFTNDQRWIILRRLYVDTLQSLDELPPEILFILEKTNEILVEESIEVLRRSITEHFTDVNIPEEDLLFWRKLVTIIDSQKTSITNLNPEGSTEKTTDITSPAEFPEIIEVNSQNHVITDWEIQTRLEAVLISYWSPYPEVRSVTFPYDDPSIPIETFRVYLIAIFWTSVGAVINQFFSERRPAITLAMSVVQVFRSESVV